MHAMNWLAFLEAVEPLRRQIRPSYVEVRHPNCEQNTDDDK